jgi:hypothetical protein
MICPALQSIFAKYRAPELADKTDLLKMQAELKAGINARATRRQTIFDIFWVIGLITPAVMLGSRFGH